MPCLPPSDRKSNFFSLQAIFPRPVEYCSRSLGNMERQQRRDGEYPAARTKGQDEEVRLDGHTRVNKLLPSTAIKGPLSPVAGPDVDLDGPQQGVLIFLRIAASLNYSLLALPSTTTGRQPQTLKLRTSRSLRPGVLCLLARASWRTSSCCALSWTENWEDT